jgi:CheY-like chemotaxis protein
MLGIFRQLMKPIKQSELLDVVLAAVGQTPQAADRQTEHSVDDDHPMPPLRVLLAVVGLANQRLAKALLEKWGHTVTIAENGRLAVDRSQAEQFDLILMDVQMPELDGLEAAQQIRRREATTGGHVPIIAMTARAMTGDRERCLAAGMDGYVAKPVRKQDLRAAMLPLFDRSSPQPVPRPRGDATEALIDWDVALRNVGGYDDILAEAMQMTLQETPQLLGNLERALHSGAEPRRAVSRTLSRRPDGRSASTR